MIIQMFFIFSVLFSFNYSFLYSITLQEQLEQNGYIEICNNEHGSADFDALYSAFDTWIDFFQENPHLANQLYIAKERFTRSIQRQLYSTDTFGYYDESKREGRRQIAFYYTPHFHDFICIHYPKIVAIPVVAHFLNTCRKIQQPYGDVIYEVASKLDLESIFVPGGGQPPILFKVIKYLPGYTPSAPHYDGTAFSLLLDSSDNDTLLLSPYKPVLCIDDFSPASRLCLRGPEQNSTLLIPGTLLTEYGIYPTPHIVAKSGKIRHASVAFAMRPYYVSKKIELTPLPKF